MNKYHSFVVPDSDHQKFSCMAFKISSVTNTSYNFENLNEKIGFE